VPEVVIGIARVGGLRTLPSCKCLDALLVASQDEVPHVGIVSIDGPIRIGVVGIGGTRTVIDLGQARGQLSMAVRRITCVRAAHRISFISVGIAPRLIIAGV
jgi:hypothetical protein